MLYFKNMGLAYYDLGGWYGGNTDKEKLAINEFKEAFGGEKTREYTYLLPLTLFGKAASCLSGLLKGR